MQALIFADRLGRELAPLSEAGCPALLPVAGKALLEHVLEDLADAGIDEAWLVVSSHTREIRRQFADGARWGIDVRYVLSRGEEAPARIVARLGSRLGCPFLALRGDILRSPMCRAFLEIALGCDDPEVSARAAGRPAALALINANTGPLHDVLWPVPTIPEQGAPSVDLAATALNLIDSPSAFHAANLAAIDGAVPGLLLPGRERVDGLRVGPLSEAAGRQLVSGRALVGSDCRLHGSARLTGTVVIGDGCYVDRQVTLRDSVVLPGTYVGEGLDLNHAIVAGEWMLRVDTGVQLRIMDGELLAPMDRRHQNKWGERAAGFGLLLASLPLWPLAVLSALAAAPSAPLNRIVLLGNRHGPDAGGRRRRLPFTSCVWMSPFPLLRHLPKLWAVVTGDLKIFGSRPAAVAESAAPAVTGPEPGILPAGLLDASLFLADGAPEEEIELKALVMAAESGWRAGLARWMRGLRLAFSTRAWWPTTAATALSHH